MKAEKLINWSELSRLLHGDRTAIRANKIPKKYMPKIRRLIKFLNNWQKTSDEIIN